jgi:dolichyl-phosphate-mannose-protein mannosyltransferase
MLHLKHSVRKYRFELILILFFAIHTVFFSLAGIISFERMNVAGIDPVCYYSYLRSLFFDRDLDFQNEYQMMDTTGALRSYPDTSIGRRPNGFSIGPGIAISPFFVAAHVLVKITGKAAADGYSSPYQSSAFIAIAFYALLGLILLYKWLCLYFKPGISLTAAAICWFAGFPVYYSYPMTFMPHAISLFSVLVFLYFIEKTRDKNEIFRWILTGILIGIMAMIRWQNILFSVFLMPDMIKIFKKDRIGFLKITSITGLTAFLAFSPQLIVWGRLYGRLLTIPQGSAFLLWTRPMITKILFSTFNGLFSWTPVTFIGISGILLWTWKWKKNPTPLLLLAIFILQLYINSIVRDWHGSWGFGMRRFMNCTPVFAAGLGYILHSLKKRIKFSYLAAALSILIIWNYLFLTQYYLHLVAWNRPLTYHEMVGDKLHIYKSIQRRSLVNTAYDSWKNGYMDDVEKAIDLAIDFDPDHADIYFTRGKIAASRDNIDLAYSFYRIAYRLSPEDRDIYRSIKELRIRRDELMEKD